MIAAGQALQAKPKPSTSCAECCIGFNSLGFHCNCDVCMLVPLAAVLPLCALGVTSVAAL
jgi:hypothetical protein